MNKKALALAVCLSAALPLGADDSLVRFKGGIGVIPVSRGTGTANADGSLPDVVRNDVRGTPAAGQIWVIAKLEAEVETDGRIEVEGRGLLLGGGNNIGTNANQSVRARLFCGTVAHDSDLVPLEANGDFEIEGSLTPLPPSPCVSPVLLIVSRGGSWFAAGIPAN
jgi:hypothetical protein